MERTLDTVLRTMANPGLTSLASGMVSASPSPPPEDDIKPTALDLVTELTSAPPPPAYHVAAPTVAVPRQPGQSTYGGGAAPNHPGTSPKLHSLPDNALNPLGLLAEASLANRRAQQAAAAATPASGPSPENVSEYSNFPDRLFRFLQKRHVSAELGQSQSWCSKRSVLQARSNDDSPIAATIYRASSPTRDVDLCDH
jgi:hypothetical protein